MTFELVSFKICPFVQRSSITLRYKEIPHEITYIDLAEPPQWFLDISPFGKVPLLRVDDAVIFESAVINEYLDEITPQPLHPADPLLRALNRAWIEFGSALITDQHRIVTASDEEGFDKAVNELALKFDRLEQCMGDGLYFNGANFSLVDAAYAPFFVRLELLLKVRAFIDVEHYPRITEWSRTLCALPAVRESVVENLPALFFAYLAKQDGYGAQVFSGAKV